MKNSAWRLGTKYGAAYIEDNGLACELLKMEGISSKPSSVAMATYYSPNGKAYAWQVKFTLDRWDKVARKLGLPVEERIAKPTPKAKAKPNPKPASKSAPKPTSKARAAAAKPPSKPASKPAAKPDIRRNGRRKAAK